MTSSDAVLAASRDEISAFVAMHEREAYVYLREYIGGALGELGLEAQKVSDARLVRAAHHFAKDIAKMKMYQDDNISVTKYVGYMCFWIRKMSPVCAVHKAGDSEQKEGKNTSDINSLVAIFVMKNLTIDMSKNFSTSSWITPYKKKIDENPDGFREGIASFFRRYYFDLSHLEYVRHCMSVRTFGPHHMVMLCDHLVYGASPSISFWQ